MVEQAHADAAQVPALRKLSFHDLGAALSAGCADFRTCPTYGLFFGAIYVLLGLVLRHALMVRGEAVWLIPSAAAFPCSRPSPRWVSTKSAGGARRACR